MRMGRERSGFYYFNPSTYNYFVRDCFISFFYEVKDLNEYKHQCAII
jgi:hypothetical protein